MNVDIYIKLTFIFQALSENGGQVMMSDNAGSCAVGQSPSTKTSTGSGVLTLSIKGNKKLITRQLNKTTVFRSVSKLKHLT